MVDIIPKPIKEKPIWQIVISYFSVFVLVGIILSYFVLISLQKKAEDNLHTLEEKIAKGKTPERISLEKEIIGEQKKIKNFSALLDQHISSSKFFQFLEEKTYSQIFFSNVNLDSKNSKVNLSGEADNLITLNQQLSIFEKEPFFEGLNLTDVSFNKEGRINFTLDIVLKPDVLKY